MSELKKIIKTISEGLPSTKSGVGMDINEIIGSEFFNKEKGDYANISAVFDTSKEKVRPEAVLAGQKDNVSAFLSGSGKDNISAGLGYTTKDALTSFGIGASKSERGSNIGFGVQSKFKKGGLLKQGKPKIALKGWK